MQKKEVGPLTYNKYKNQLNLDWNLNVRPKMIKFLQENTAGKLHDIDFGNDFSDITPKVQAIKENIGNWNPLELKTFRPSKEN